MVRRLPESVGVAAAATAALPFYATMLRVRADVAHAQALVQAAGLDREPICEEAQARYARDSRTTTRFSDHVAAIVREETQ